MQQSMGAIFPQSVVGEGTAVQLYFPAEVVEKGNASLSGKEEASLQEGAAGRILLVEDQYDVRKVVATILKSAGYAVVTAESGDDALEIYADSPDFDLLLTDLVMPGNLQGPALASTLREMSPVLPVIYLSGHDDSLNSSHESALANIQRLTKPVARKDLLTAVAKAIPKGGPKT